MSLRKAFFPLTGEWIEVDGDSATLNGEPVTADDAARLVDKRLTDLLMPRTVAVSIIAAPGVAAFAPLGSDPDDQAAWTWIGTADGLDGGEQVPPAGDGGI